MSLSIPGRLTAHSCILLRGFSGNAIRVSNVSFSTSRVLASTSASVAVETPTNQGPNQETVPERTLGIPESPEWKILPIPKSTRDLVGAVTSKEFQQTVSSPLGAALSAYSAIRTAYFIGQALYTARTINYRPSSGTFKDGVPTNPFEILRLVTDRMAPTLGGIAELYRRDAENVKSGLYRGPYDMDPRHRQWHPSYIRDNVNSFMQFAKDTWERRNRKGGFEVRETSEEAKRNRDRYPEYYLQNFHFQDGWLSEFSAETYEIATETLFLGAQDAMQRGSLIPLHYFMFGRAENKTKLLDLACGTGRFLTFIKDNYPQMDTIGVDLSPFFLEKAKGNMSYFTEFDKMVNGERMFGPSEYLQASAEQVPLESASVDVISCVYLFHELPPVARERVVGEMHRLLRKGGIVILNDSIQREDRPEYNFSLFPENYHEPYFLSYVDLDFKELFSKNGFCFESSSIHHVSKVMCFSKV